MIVIESRGSGFGVRGSGLGARGSGFGVWGSGLVQRCEHDYSVTPASLPIFGRTLLTEAMSKIKQPAGGRYRSRHLHFACRSMVPHENGGSVNRETADGRRRWETGDVDGRRETGKRSTTINDQLSTIDHPRTCELANLEPANIPTFKPSNGASTSTITMTITITNYDYELRLRTTSTNHQPSTINHQPFLGPKIAVPTRTYVAPSAMAASKSFVMPMDSSSSRAAPRQRPAHASRSRRSSRK